MDFILVILIFRLGHFGVKRLYLPQVIRLSLIQLDKVICSYGRGDTRPSMLVEISYFMLMVSPERQRALLPTC